MAPIWVWRPAGLGLGPRRFGIDGTMLHSQRDKGPVDISSAPPAGPPPRSLWPFPSAVRVEPYEHRRYPGFTRSLARGALPGGRPGRRNGCRGRTKGWSGRGGARGLVVPLQKSRLDASMLVAVAQNAPPSIAGMASNIIDGAQAKSRRSASVHARLTSEFTMCLTEVALRKPMRFAYHSRIIVV